MPKNILQKLHFTSNERTPHPCLTPPSVGMPCDINVIYTPLDWKVGLHLMGYNIVCDNTGLSSFV